MLIPYFGTIFSSCWKDQKLTDQNHNDNVKACKKKVPIFRNGPWRLCDIAVVLFTGDEPWFYLRQVGNNSANRR